MTMDTPHPPFISSFILRFVMVVEPGRDIEPGVNAYRGEIRHIQTSQEIRFDAWPEAVEFIRRFVPLEAEDTPSR